MRKARGGGGGDAAIPEGGGASLDAGTQQRMEGALGADLSSVRVHTGPESAAAAKDMGAQAFTVGNDVHFGASQFSPGSPQGDYLIAHELTHVVQGGGQGAPARKAEPGGESLAVSQPHEPAEVEADAMASHAMSVLHGGAAGPAPRIQAKLDGGGASRKVWRFGAETRTAANPKDASRPLVKVDAHPSTGPFEANLGVLAMGHPASNAAASAMMTKVSAFLQAEAKGYDSVAKTQEQVDADAAKLAQKMGTDPKKYGGIAGGVLASKVSEVIAEGNIRERMTVAYNFMRIFDESMRSKTTAEREELMKRADLNKTKINAALSKMAQDADGKVTVAEGQRPPSFAGTPAKSVTEAMGGQDKARVETEQGASTQTVGSLAAAGPTVAAHEGADGGKVAEKSYQGAAAMSARELEFNNAAKPQPGVEDPNNVLLAWDEGDKKWAADASSDFVKKLDQMKLPFGAGPSGTTSRLFQVAENLNVNMPNNVRLACIGYLLPIHAHSLVEVMQAASGHGCAPPTYDLTLYRKIDPLNEAELRACGGGKFPDEVAAAEQQASGAATPTGAPPAPPAPPSGDAK